MTAMEIVGRTRASARRFASDCSGTTAMEYAVVAALIGGTVVVGISALGGAVGDRYDRAAAVFTG